MEARYPQLWTTLTNPPAIASEGTRMPISSTISIFGMRGKGMAALGRVVLAKRERVIMPTRAFASSTLRTFVRCRAFASY